jgi:lipoprotein-releasing system permease protein
MKIKLILSIAKTHLLSRKKQTIIAALGVMFGIAAYVIMMSFMTGLNGLLDGLVLNRTPHVHIYNELNINENQPISKSSKFDGKALMINNIRPSREQTRIHNATALMNYLNSEPEVRAATPLVKAQGFYTGGSTRLSAVILGVNPLEEAKFYKLSDYIVSGSVEDLATNENGILLGKGVADVLTIGIGDLVQVSTITGDLFPLKVVGLYQSGLADIDKVQSYVNLKTAQRIMGESVNYITDINVKLYDMELAPEMAKDFEKKYDLTAVDIQAANAQYETGSYVRNLISYAVSITLLIVAGFGIYNILNMFIYEKINDIAILKATGFSNNDVQRIFLSEAVIIGIIGGVLGIILGYLGSYSISQAPFETDALPTIKKMPVNFDPMFYVIGVIFALVSTFFAGYLPAKRAQRLDPVDIIRGQ